MSSRWVVSKKRALTRFVSRSDWLTKVVQFLSFCVGTLYFWQAAATIGSCHCFAFPFPIPTDVGNSIGQILEEKENSLKCAATKDEVLNNFERKSVGYNVSWACCQGPLWACPQNLDPPKQTNLKAGISRRVRSLGGERYTFCGDDWGGLVCYRKWTKGWTGNCEAIKERYHLCYVQALARIGRHLPGQRGSTEKTI